MFTCHGGGRRSRASCRHAPMLRGHVGPVAWGTAASQSIDVEGQAEGRGCGADRATSDSSDEPIDAGKRQYGGRSCRDWNRGSGDGTGGLVAV